MKLLVPFQFLIFLILAPVNSKAVDQNICENIIVQGDRIELNRNEKILLCGIAEGPQPWNEIPLPQVKLHLRNILNNLGYFQSTTEIRENKLFVQTGPQQKITSVSTSHLNNILDVNKLRNVVGKPLVPGKLDEVDSWANFKLQSQGYACSDISLKAQSETGKVQVNVKASSPKFFSAVFTDNSDQINGELLPRYQPFEMGDMYDVRKTHVMTERLISDGLFQSAYFEIECKEDKVILRLRSSIGKPKILRFGVGASTEELPFADLTFRNAQLDSLGSSFTTTLHASPRNLSLDFTSELYWFRGWNKTFFAPRGHLLREIESAYQSDSARLGADIGRFWDQWNTRFQVRLGPSLNIVTTQRGAAPEHVRYPSFDASLLLMSIDYEYAIRQQHEGWMASLGTRSQSRGLGSEYNVNHYNLNYKYLWNIGNYYPPLFVLGRVSSELV